MWSKSSLVATTLKIGILLHCIIFVCSFFLFLFVLKILNFSTWQLCYLKTQYVCLFVRITWIFLSFEMFIEFTTSSRHCCTLEPFFAVTNVICSCGGNCHLLLPDWQKEKSFINICCIYSVWNLLLFLWRKQNFSSSQANIQTKSSTPSHFCIVLKLVNFVCWCTYP